MRLILGELFFPFLIEMQGQVSKAICSVLLVKGEGLLLRNITLIFAVEIEIVERLWSRLIDLYCTVPFDIYNRIILFAIPKVTSLALYLVLNVSVSDGLIVEPFNKLSTPQAPSPPSLNNHDRLVQILQLLWCYASIEIAIHQLSSFLFMSLFIA